MASVFEFSVDDRSKRRLRELAKQFEPTEFLNRLFQIMDTLGSIVAGKVIEEGLSGRSGGFGLARRTGALARSVQGRGVRINGIPAIKVGVFRGPALAYAGIQETGGTIKPVRAKALAIPVGPALTPSGVPRFSGPRALNLRFLPFRRGIAVGKLVDEKEAKQAQDRGGSPYDARAFYILMTKVEIPASRWLSGPIRANIPFIAAQLEDLIRRKVLV